MVQVNMKQRACRLYCKNLQDEENITNISAFISQGQPIDFAGLVKQSALKIVKTKLNL